MTSSPAISKIVHHSHIYDINPTRPVSEVITTAEADAENFWNSGSLSTVAEQFSNPDVKVGANEDGGMYAYWSQSGAVSEDAFASKADSIGTELANVYLIPSPHPSASEVRAALDKAEADAKAYAESNDLEYSDGIVRLTATEESIVIMWSEESDEVEGEEK
jgi:hypothetical protein